MKKLLSIFLLISVCAKAQFGPSTNSYFDVATEAPASSFLILNTPGVGNYNLSATNALELLNASAVNPISVSPATVAAIMATNNAAGLTNATSIKFYLDGVKVGDVFKPTGHEASKASIVWGSTNNYIPPDIYSAVISGGGDTGTYSNFVYSPASTISGGVGSWIYGGDYTHANTIGGGELNRIYSNAAYATIAGGEVGRIGDPTGVAIVSGVNSTIGGGGRNFIIGTNVNGSTISGGNDGYIHSKSSVIVGGGDYDLGNWASNSINADFGAILGGFKNYIGTGAPMSTIIGYGVTASTKSIKLGYTNNVVTITPDGKITGDGSGLSLNADNLNQGIIPDARLQGSYSSDLYFLNSGNVIWGAFDAFDSGNGYSLNVQPPASGFGAMIGGGLIVTNGITMTSGTLTANGAGLTNIPATALQSFGQVSTSFTGNTNVTLDISLVNATTNVFFTSLTTNAYFGQPSNLTAGKSFSVWLRQDSTGNRSVNFNTNYWRFPSAQILTTTTNPSSSSLMSCIVMPFATNVAVVQTLNFQ